MTRLRSQSSTPRRRPVQRKLQKPGRFILILLCILTLPCLAWWLLHATPAPAAAAVPATPSLPTGRMTFLLMGADERPEDVGRSDTIILGSVDFDQKTAELFSLSRDMFVQIPGHGWDKLNSAYAYGGLDLTRRTLENLLGIPLQHHVLVNMRGLQQAVDALGGIQIDVEKDMHYEDPQDSPPLKIDLKAGLQTLDGTRVLHYARYRADAEADRGRMRRQQTVIKALARTALKPENLPRLPSVVARLVDSVKTDLSTVEIGRLGLAAAQLDLAAIKGGQVEGTDIYMDGIYYFVPDLTDLRTQVYRVMHGQEPDARFLSQAAKDDATYSGTVAAQADPPDPPEPVRTSVTANPGPESATSSGTGSQTRPAAPAPTGTAGKPPAPSAGGKPAKPGTVTPPATGRKSTDTGSQPDSGTAGTDTGTNTDPIRNIR